MSWRFDRCHRDQRILDELKEALLSRGFTAKGGSPHNTVVFPFPLMSNVEIADLLETMVARCEKTFRSQSVVGEEAARKSWENVIIIIDAVKAVIGRLTVP